MAGTDSKFDGREEAFDYLSLATGAPVAPVEAIDDLDLTYVVPGNSDERVLSLSVSLLHEQIETALGGNDGIRLGSFTLLRAVDGVHVQFDGQDLLRLPLNPGAFKDTLSTWRPEVEGYAMYELNQVLFA